jgi:hypothetical protein
VYVLLAPFVVMGVAAYGRSRRSWAWPAALVTFTVACLALSWWLAQQAVALR